MKSATSSNEKDIWCGVWVWKELHCKIKIRGLSCRALHKAFSLSNCLSLCPSNTYKLLNKQGSDCSTDSIKATWDCQWKPNKHATAKANVFNMGKWINNHRGYSVSDLSDEILKNTLQLKASNWKDPNHTGAKTNNTLGGIINKRLTNIPKVFNWKLYVINDIIEPVVNIRIHLNFLLNPLTAEGSGKCFTSVM